jgi:hypothetical protein
MYYKTSPFKSYGSSKQITLINQLINFLNFSVWKPEPDTKKSQGYKNKNRHEKRGNPPSKVASPLASGGTD